MAVKARSRAGPQSSGGAASVEEPEREADLEELSEIAAVGSLATGRITAKQIEEVTRLLRSGRPLPTHLVPYLFEVPREYELSYRGKMRKAEVLSDTMAMPLQAVRTYGKQRSHWSNLLVLGDNLQVLRQLVNLKAAGQLRNTDGSDGARLCYIDPPFGTQQDFTGNRNEKAYQDRVAGAEFVEHLRRRLILIREVLTGDGFLVVHLDQRKVHYIKVVLDEVFGEANFRNEIIVKRPISKNLQAQFEFISSLPVGHDSLLVYSTSSGTRFPAPLRPLEKQKHPDGYWHRFWSGADRPTMRYKLLGVTPAQGQWKWKRERALAAVENYDRYLREAHGRSLVKYWMDTGRTLEFIRKGKNGDPENWFAPSETQIADTLWLHLKTYANQKQYPTEKHVELLKFIIQAFSRPGDIVIDAFVGSGTTLEAAQTLHQPRRWIGVDSGKFAIYVSQARLLRLAGKKAPEQGFTLYNAGLYDYRALKGLPWQHYIDFVLQLFQCQKSEHNLGGVTFQGYIGDDSVLVYDFKQQPKARIGLAFVQDIANLCRGRLGDRCFIVAPSGAVEPYEDYLTVTGIRFYFLRIPYSIIAELHRKAFTDLRQPTSEAQTNAPIDSVGFDFMQPPAVECKYTVSGDALNIQIISFESEAFSALPSGEPISDLAMILVDYSYDDDVFDLDAVHFAEDLKAAGWRFQIPKKAAGDRILIVYIDLHGNEFREVKVPKEFKALKSVSQRTRPSA